MSLVIGTNVSALVAQQNLSTANSQLKVSVQRLSSGYRVNSAADDAAGLARADQLKSYSRMIQAAQRNSNDGVSSLEVMDKAAEKITEILTRMAELAAAASTGTLDATTRGYYNSEFTNLRSEIDRISSVTEFGGTLLLDGLTASITIQIGFKSTPNDRLIINLSDLTTGLTGLNIAANDLTTAANAQTAIGSIQSAITTVNNARATFGSNSNRLQAAISNLNVTFTNFQAAESRIRDADFAYETALYTRNQILVQAGTSVLAQANALPQNVLTLLR